MEEAGNRNIRTVFFLSFRTLLLAHDAPTRHRPLPPPLLPPPSLPLQPPKNHSYLPVYLQDVLGLSNSKIGNLQAIAQFLCNASKSLSGTLADVLSPARMVIFGTLLTTLNKPMFAASGWVYASFGTLATLYWITAGKVFDRMSKGIREAPGKALIGDLAAASGDSPEGAFGLRQALATTGALLGSAIAGLAYKLSGQNYVLTFALAAAPAAAALVLTVGAFGPMAAESAAKKKQAAADEAAAVAAGERDELMFFFFFFSSVPWPFFALEREREKRAKDEKEKRGRKTHTTFKKKKKKTQHLRRQEKGGRPRRQVPRGQGQGPRLGPHPGLLAGPRRRLAALLRPLRRLVHHAAREAGAAQDAAPPADVADDGGAGGAGRARRAQGQEVAQGQEQVG